MSAKNNSDNMFLDKCICGKYLTTFSFPDNLIVVRFIVEQPYFSNETQNIWNSAFTWQQIKEHLEDNTYNFVFRHENISISMRNIDDMITSIIEDEDAANSHSTDQEELEAANSLRVAVDGLPEFLVISKESENGDDAVICSICYETFSNEMPAKQLSCEHLYHSKCILLWFRRKNSCPTCISE